MHDILRRKLAEAYARMLGDVLHPMGVAAEPEEVGCLGDGLRPSELDLQGCWMTGQLGCGGETEHHGHVRIIDFGTWNRSAGPDFLRAEIELNGRRMRGDIELDSRAQDWENHGHGANAQYDDVVLHVVLGPVPGGWYTRNSRHEEVPVLSIPRERCRAALGMSLPLNGADLELCARPLSGMPVQSVQSLLQAAASYRMQTKRKNFRRKMAGLGSRQAWYEAWAETLGYRVNKQQMQMLARRAPLRELGRHAEAILFGTAGFLRAVLPEDATEEVRMYHRAVWDAWWPLRDRFSLSGPCRIPWVLASTRPLNHPHRRVAALAVSARRWHEMEPLLNARGAQQLLKLLGSLRHPYWSYHCSLPSAQLSKACALVGRDRAQSFLVNHVYVQDDSQEAWDKFLTLRENAPASRVQRAAERLFGGREDIAPLLRYSYAQQALLQIDADFCCSNICQECLFPSQLKAWSQGV